MDPMQIATGLAEIEGRAAGSDAERRAALWLRRRLRADGRDARLEPEWVRPQWAAVHAFHVAAGVAASLIALSSSTVGLALLAAVVVSMALDLLGVAHLLRRVSPERATQNVVSPPIAATRSSPEQTVRLVVLAHYDAPRGGMARRDGLRRVAATAQRACRGYLPGALGVMFLALVALLAVAVARRAGLEGRWLDLVQLVPTLLLLAGLASLIDLGLAGPGPGAGESASAAAVALALVDALDRAPPRHLAVELVLAGAGDGPSLGMRAFAQRRKRRYRPEATAVLHIAPCGRGRPRWWTVDGALAPRRLHPRLAALCADVARTRPVLRARAHRGHGAGAGWRARLAGWPAITVGCLDGHGLVPAAGQGSDRADRLDAGAMRAALGLCRELVARLDDDVGRRADARRE